MLGDRSQFPDLAGIAYLNHAAMSPPSVAVRAACLRMIDDYARHGASAWMRQLDSRERLRARLARLVGGAAEEIAVIPGTGHAASMIALSIPWRTGDRILLLRGEFPANVTPWQRAAERFGLGLEFLDVAAFDRNGDGLTQLARVLARGIRLMAVSAVQFQTGYCMPLRDIATLCARFGTQVFVDGIQAVGSVPIDVSRLPIDYLAAGGHKWLMGLEGTGFLWIRAARARELEPAIAGWLSHEDGVRFLFEGAGHLRYDRPLRRRADVFEIGVTNAVGFAALDASTASLEAHGIEQIHAHVQPILDGLECAFASHGFVSARHSDPGARSCILSLRPPADVDLASLAAALGNRGVSVATPDGYLRLSPHWPNDLSQVAPSVAALEDSLRELRS